MVHVYVHTCLCVCVLAYECSWHACAVLCVCVCMWQGCTLSCLWLVTSPQWAVPASGLVPAPLLCC